MITVGAFEAKTHLSTLLERVSRGEEVLIKRDGKVVARLVPAGTTDCSDIDKTIAKLKATLGRLDWTMLRDEGRR